MRIAVTGAGGYIGKSYINLLNQNNIEYVSISRSEGIDVLNLDSLLEQPKCTHIVHLAAKTFVPESFDKPGDFYKFNLNSTINILELAKKWDAHIINMSSYLYGPPQYLPVDEKHSINPHNPYARTKWITEELVEGYGKDFDVAFTTLRLFNLYGPQQAGKLIIPEIMQQISSGIVTLKDPRPKRDYIHIKDVVNAIYKVLMKSELSKGQVFNLGTGHSRSVRELVQIIQKYSPIKFEINFTNEIRKGEVLDSVADMSKMKKVLNWTPQISLEEGIERFFR